MAAITLKALLNAIDKVDLTELDAQGKTIFIEGNECSPKYLMYLVEYLTGVPYSVYKLTNKKRKTR